MQRTQCNYWYRCKKFVIVESFNSILRICFLLNHVQENITRYFHGLIFSFSWLQRFLQHSTFSPSLYNPIYNRWIYNAFAIYITRNKMLLPTLSLYAYTFYFETISTCYNRVNVLFWLTRYLICVLLFITQRYKLSVA